MFEKPRNAPRSDPPANAKESRAGTVTKIVRAAREWFFGSDPELDSRGDEEKIGGFVYHTPKAAPVLHEAWTAEQQQPAPNPFTGRTTKWITPSPSGPWIDGPRRNPWHSDEPRRNRWEQ
jgi:hypothetical protein